MFSSSEMVPLAVVYSTYFSRVSYYDIYLVNAQATMSEVFTALSKALLVGTGVVQPHNLRRTLFVCIPGAQQDISTHGEALFREIAHHDQERIVAKRLDAPYRAGRQPTWLKIKNKDYSRRAAVEWHG